MHRRALAILFAVWATLALTAGVASAKASGTREATANTPPSLERFTAPERYVKVTGVLRRQGLGVPSYPYGTHAIRDANTGRMYALRSEHPWLLNFYVNKRVVVYGVRAKGYFGPPLLDVYRVLARPSSG